jgi:steroid delta-isomerase-like uncharacterized protein
VRRNTEEVQGKGNWDLYEELFADDFVDHTPQPGTTPDKDGVRVLYKSLRAAFPDFRPEIHWQVAAGDLVTTYKTYHGTHEGEFLGIPATGKKVSFYTVDAMRVVDGKITEHWGVTTLLDLMQQLGVVPLLGGKRRRHRSLGGPQARRVVEDACMNQSMSRTRRRHSRKGNHVGPTPPFSGAPLTARPLQRVISCGGGRRTACARSRPRVR